MTGSMKAAVYRGVDDVRLEQVPIPEIGKGEVLVKVESCGVCGTDLKKIHLGLAAPPRIFGHETAGTIAALGQGVQKWKEGDRVAVNHHVPCMQPACPFCRRKAFAQCPVYKKTGATSGFEPAGGGFAEYVRVMDWCVEKGLVGIPAGTSSEEACFIEPLNTCLKAVELASPLPGDIALILGQGTIGLFFTQLLHQAGIRVIASDYLQDRLEWSKELGAEWAASPDEADAVTQALTEGRGADLVIVTVADTRAAEKAISWTRPAGTILLFAQTRENDPMTVDAGSICLQEKRLIGSYSSDITLQERAAQMIFSHSVKTLELITHRFPLEEIEAAIMTASHPAKGALKVMIRP